MLSRFSLPTHLIVVLTLFTGSSRMPAEEGQASGHHRTGPACAARSRRLPALPPLPRARVAPVPQPSSEIHVLRRPELL